jgi:hypothetical protein
MALHRRYRAGIGWLCSVDTDIFVAVGSWKVAGEALIERSWTILGSGQFWADGFRIGAEGLDLVSSRDVDGDELRHAFQDGLMRLGFGAEDSREMAPVVDEVDADGATTVGGAGERVGVEEDPIADSCRWAGGAVRI